jgi:transposase
MSIVVAGFDIHRAQITFDALDTETGEVSAGKIPSTPEAVARWVERYPGREVHVALEACTGWYFVARALERSDSVPHLAEVAETRALRGRKRRAKTDRADARWLRTLLQEGRLPEAWIPPDHICHLRLLTRLRKTLVDERTAWQLRIQAVLFHLGMPSLPKGHAGESAREWLAALDLPAAASMRVESCLGMIEAIDGQLDPLDRQLRAYSRRQPGCRALMGHFGVGERTAPTILAELGDVSRLRRSRQAVRLAGLDIGVSRSDRRSRVGKITKQGSPYLRWALYEAAQSACRKRSPDHADYLALRERRLSHTRASLTIARKLARRAFHTLRELGPEALEPAEIG